MNINYKKIRIMTEMNETMAMTIEEQAKAAIADIQAAAKEAEDVIKNAIAKDECDFMCKDSAEECNTWAKTEDKDRSIIPEKMVIKIINLMLNYLDWGVTVPKDTVAFSELVKDIYQDIKKIDNGFLIGSLDCSNVINYLKIGSEGGKMNSYNLPESLSKARTGNSRGNHIDYIQNISRVIDLIKEKHLSKRLFEKELGDLVKKYYDDLKVSVSPIYPEDKKVESQSTAKTDETEYMKRVAAGTSDTDIIEDAVESGESIETPTEVVTPISSATAIIKDMITEQYTVAYLTGDDIELDSIPDRLALEMLGSVCTGEAVDFDSVKKDVSNVIDMLECSCKEEDNNVD